jgi:hypothetical protein
MPDIISEYQEWKERGDSLRSKAKQAMEVRFRELLLEAARIGDDYRADFGKPLKPPHSVIAFRYKSQTRAGFKTGVKKKAPGKKSAPAAETTKPSPKVAGLQKRLATAKHKLEEAKAANGPTRPLEDRIYELEDDLRLAQG